jgi:TatD DNase family protein
MKIIDTHSHYNLKQFDEDRNPAILRMDDAGVGTICVGVDYFSSVFAVEVARGTTNIWACVGQHPTEWERHWDDAVVNADAFEKLTKEERVVAIGECGLDYYREEERAHKVEQEKLFRAQIELAIRTNLPLMLHIRPMQGTMDAYEDALRILKTYKVVHPSLTGTAHFFVGNTDIAQQFLDLGFYISFSGVITIFPEYEDLVKFVPIDRILPETDAPYAAPLEHRGQRNEPAFVLETVKKIAILKDMSLEETEQQLLSNAKTLFKLS